MSDCRAKLCSKPTSAIHIDHTHTHTHRQTLSIIIYNVWHLANVCLSLLLRDSQSELSGYGSKLGREREGGREGGRERERERERGLRRLSGGLGGWRIINVCIWQRALECGCLQSELSGDGGKIERGREGVSE